MNGLGDQVPYNCPGCGGVLWQMDTPGEKRYRCHTGHSYSGPTLLASQAEKIEEMLWISLRMFEERKNLLVSMTKEARTAAGQDFDTSAGQRNSGVHRSYSRDAAQAWFNGFGRHAHACQGVDGGATSSQVHALKRCATW